MTSMMVKFEQPNQIYDFVNTVNQFDCEADLRLGSCVVDAKSILGVMTLAIAHTVELILHTDELSNQDAMLRLMKYAV